MSAEESLHAGPDRIEKIPLVVDVDRTLVSTDLMWEGIISVLFTRPHRLLAVAATLFRGRAAFKARLAQEAELEIDHLPLRADVLRLVREAKEDDRPVVLASAAYFEQVEQLGERVGADHVIASSDTENVKGVRKLKRVQEMFESFDYVGDGAADLSLLRAARCGALVDPGRWARHRHRHGGTGDSNFEVIDRSYGQSLGSWLRALRPHQWTKNALLVLPVLAAHLTWSLDLAVNMAAGFGAFSLLASAVYLLNDLSDLPADRVHPSKWQRPLASGSISIPVGIGTSLFLIAGSALLALQLPRAFQLTLAVYAALNLGYSFGLKSLVALDVVLLAALYTIRVIAGAALAEIHLTGWFLAFSIFLFLSLAVLKRVIELDAIGQEDAPSVSTRRPYRTDDLPVLWAVGPTAGVMSALVYCLYITGPVRRLYSHPDLLWIGLPLLLYWLLRIWLLAMRGEVEEDPVVFVLRDPPSYAVLLAFLGVVFVSA